MSFDRKGRLWISTSQSGVSLSGFVEVPLLRTAERPLHGFPISERREVHEPERIRSLDRTSLRPAASFVATGFAVEPEERRSTLSYTNQLIQDRQARSVGDLTARVAESLALDSDEVQRIRTAALPAHRSWPDVRAPPPVKTIRRCE